MKISFPGKNLGEYLLLKGFAAFLNALPIETATTIARAFAALYYYAVPKRRRATLENLEKAFPGPENQKKREQIALEAYRSVGTSLVEFFRIPAMLKEAPGRFEFEGTEILDAAFARGKGIIFAISHLGSWEYLAFLPYLRGYPCSVIVRETKNPYVFPVIQALREKTKLHPIHREQSAKEILKQLKQNRLVAILIDQWAGPNGIWTNFFGHPTSTTSVPARLAKRMGAAIVPGYCLRVAPGRYRIVIRPEVPIEGTEEDYERKTTDRLNRLLEDEILRNPGQWVWGHRRWKPRQRYSAAAASEAP